MKIRKIVSFLPIATSSKTSRIFLYKDRKNRAKRSFKEILSSPILLPRSGTSSGERDSGGSIVPRRNVFRSSRSPWKASWRCITKRWRGSRVCTNLLLLFEKKKKKKRRDPRKGRETTVEYRGATTPGGKKERRRRRRRRRRRSVGGVCSLLPGDRVHRLLRCRCPEIENLREEPGGAAATRLAFSSKADRGNRLNEVEKKRALGLGNFIIHGGVGRREMCPS